MLAPEFFNDRFVPAFAPLAAYHRFESVGLERIPASGRALLLITHSAATYELLLAIRAIYLATGRIVRSLADRIWFRVPVLGGWVRRIGVAATAVPSRRKSLAFSCLGAILARNPLDANMRFRKVSRMVLTDSPSSTSTWASGRNSAPLLVFCP